jgi:hypothetical protein
MIINKVNPYWVKICGYVCPMCGSKNIFLNNKRPGQYYECPDCGSVDLTIVTEEEHKNYNRTKLIDKMINYEKENDTTGN